MTATQSSTGKFHKRTCLYYRDVLHRMHVLILLFSLRPKVNELTGMKEICKKLSPHRQRIHCAVAKQLQWADVQSVSKAFVSRQIHQVVIWLSLLGTFATFESSHHLKFWESSRILALLHLIFENRVVLIFPYLWSTSQSLRIPRDILPYRLFS